jgi:transcriptional regulator with XRE-family HTH domain
VIDGAYLKSLRKSRGMQAEAVATRAGLTKQQYSNIENGKRAIEVNEYVAIMGAMDYKAGDHLPNAMGDDVATYLPLVEQLRRFSPEALPRIHEMLKLHALMLEENLLRAQSETSVGSQAYNRSVKTDTYSEPFGVRDGGGISGVPFGGAHLASAGRHGGKKKGDPA